MVNFILIIHLLIAIALISLVLIQKTDSSAMGGMAGGVSANNLARPRSRANPLTRATTFLGIAFFATSLGLAIIAKQQMTAGGSILDLPSSSGGAAPSVSDSVQSPEPAAAESDTPETPEANAPVVPTVP